jgi:hypothetical protein
MNKEQQRIAIAEACGWKLVTDNPEYEPYWEDPKGNMVAVNNGVHRLPNYLNDLNAMHEAEKVLWEMDWSFRSIFNDHLANIIKRRKVNRNEWDAETLLDATAAQRAEAFVKTLSK